MRLGPAGVALGLDLAMALEKKLFDLEVSVGEIGEVTGVDEAIVPPTPVRSVGDTSFTFPVMEHAVGATVAEGVISAGLCGEPIAITKGTFELDAVLGLRAGDEGCAWFEVDPVEPVRERKASGAGIAELAVELLARTSSLEADLVGSPELDEFDNLRDGGCRGVFARSGEFRIASAITSTRGGVRRPETAVRSPPIGDSNRPKRGRGGRSGVAFPLSGSGTEADRARDSTVFFSSTLMFRSLFEAGDHSGVLGCAYN